MLTVARFTGEVGDRPEILKYLSDKFLVVLLLLLKYFQVGDRPKETQRKFPQQPEPPLP